MKEIEVKTMTEIGNLLTSNGELMMDLNYNDVVTILGELKYEGDYLDLDFYTTQNLIRVSTSKLKGQILFKKGLINSLTLNFDDNEIDKMTSSIKKDFEKIKAIKEGTENLIQQITLSNGEKVKGRKYFRKFDNGCIDLGSPTSKWPFIIISFAKMNS